MKAEYNDPLNKGERNGMDLLTAISVRHSRRHYIDEPMTSIFCDRLRAEADRLNAESGLSIRLITDRHELFKGGFGLFQGARNAFIFSGSADNPDLSEQCGYWGERLLLYATTMNLGTCWIAATYNRALAQSLIPAGERLVCIAAVGLIKDEMSMRESVQYRLIHRACKPVSALCRYDRCSERFMAGMEAVRLAPSAMNRQPVFFELKNGAVTARVSPSAYAPVDLGIAKAHFELAAGPGRWAWGSGAAFESDEPF